MHTYRYFLTRLKNYYYEHGLVRTLSKIREKLSAQIYSYSEDFDERTVADAIQKFRKKPLISIIMPVYDVPPRYLFKAIQSVEKQLYPNWELCIADDASKNKDTVDYLKGIMNDKVKVKFLSENKGISGASNEAVSISSGEYLALLDNDDKLTRDALYEAVKAINESDADVIYSDEDFIDKNGKFLAAHFKPDYSPDLLNSYNYITHLLIFKRNLFDRSGKFDSAYDGAQDYDLILKLVEKTDKIHHVKKVLYHWRTLKTSTSSSSGAKTYADDAGKLALEASLKRKKIAGEVLKINVRFNYRVKRKIHDFCKISIIIPFKDESKLLDSCINSILNRSSYRNYEILGISNGSEKPETFALMEQLKYHDSRIRFYEYNIPFNYSKINNYAAAMATGEHVILLNNDIEIISEEWIESLLEHSQRSDVGAVGGKLYYRNNRIQHAGIIIGIAGFAGHSHRHFRRTDLGYYHRLISIQNYSAVTGALMMVKKRLYDEVGGLDEENLSIALNDVDFCLKLRAKGYLNVFTPYCEAYHYESYSRGYEDTEEKSKRFEKEKNYFIEKYRNLIINGDPYYNPNLNLNSEDFSLVK